MARLNPVRSMCRPAAAAAAVVVALVTAAHLGMTPAVGDDAALGVLAAEQRILGRTSSLQTVTVAHPDQLSSDLQAPITWWKDGETRALSPTVTKVAPGHQAVLYALRLLGMTPGGAVKSVVFAAWIVGMAAWAAYFLRVSSSSALGMGLVGAFALFRMSHYDGFVYLGGETLLWAWYPIAVMVNLRAAESSTRRWAVAAGILAVWSIALKPSAILLVAGIGAWWGIRYGLRRSSAGLVTAWACGGALGVISAAAAGLMPFNLAAAGRNEGLCTVEPVVAATWATGAWLLGLSDLAAAVESTGRHAVFYARAESALPFLWLSPGSTGWLSVAVAALTGWLAFEWVRHARFNQGLTPEAREALLLACTTIVVVAAGIFLLQMRGACVSLEGRHQQYGGFLALPFIAAAVLALLRSGQRTTKAGAICVACLVLALPAVYGTAALVDKVFVRMPSSTSAIGADGLRRDWLPAGVSASAFDADVEQILKGRLVAAPAVVALAFPAARHFIVWGPSTTAPPPLDGIVLIVRGPTAERVSTVQSMFRGVDAWGERLAGGVSVYISEASSLR